mgnify:CR=1 FL=1
MPKRTVDYTLDVLNALKAEGCKDVVDKGVLIKKIRLMVGDKGDVPLRYVDFMEGQGLIVCEGAVCKVDWDRVERLEGV